MVMFHCYVSLPEGKSERHHLRMRRMRIPDELDDQWFLHGIDVAETMTVNMDGSMTKRWHSDR